MGEWTNLRIKEKVKFETNLTRTHVTISTLHGKYTKSVDELRAKVNDPDVLVDVRKMFRAMLEYYEHQD